MDVPTDNPLSEEQSWTYIRDVIHGLEYRKSSIFLQILSMQRVG